MPSDAPDAGTPAIDIKPRSRDVTDGLEKTAARGMLRAVGMGDDAVSYTHLTLPTILRV